MKMIANLNVQELKDIIFKHFKEKGWAVKNVKFNITTEYQGYGCSEEVVHIFRGTDIEIEDGGALSSFSKKE